MTFESQHETMYFLTHAHNEDSNQPVHLCSLYCANFASVAVQNVPSDYFGQTA